MAFYILSQNQDIPGSASVVDVPEKIDPSDFLRGKWVDEEALPEHTPQSPRLLDLHPRSGDYRGGIIQGLVTLYHRKFIDILGEYGLSDVQYFPVGLREIKSGRLEGGYSLVNPLARVKCLDMEKSEYTLDSSGNPKWLKKIVIDEDAARGMPLFRLDEDPTKIIINNHLKDYLTEIDKQGGIGGLHILNTEYHMYDPD